MLSISSKATLVNEKSFSQFMRRMTRSGPGARSTRNGPGSPVVAAKRPICLATSPRMTVTQRRKRKVQEVEMEEEAPVLLLVVVLHSQRRLSDLVCVYPMLSDVVSFDETIKNFSKQFSLFHFIKKYGY